MLFKLKQKIINHRHLNIYTICKYFKMYIERHYTYIKQLYIYFDVLNLFTLNCQEDLLICLYIQRPIVVVVKIQS